MPPSKSQSYSLDKGVAVTSELDKTVSFDSDSIPVGGYRGFLAFLTVIKDVNGTLDIKFQTYDEIKAKWYDIPNAEYVQVTTANSDQVLSVYPGITAVANVAVNALIGRYIKAVHTIGGSGQYDIDLNFILVT